MTVSVTYTNGQVITADDLNTANAELSALVASVPAGNLQGGIRARDLSDRYAISFPGVQAIPVTSNDSIIAPTGFVLDVTQRRVASIEPSIPEGAEAYLCAVTITVEEADVVAVNDWNLEIRKQDGTVIGGQSVTIDGSLDDVKYIIAKPDFIADPLESFSAGERFEVWVDDGGSGAQPRGVRVDLTIKTVLNS